MKTKKHAPIVSWLTTAALLLSMCVGLTFSQRSSAQVYQAYEDSTNAGTSRQTAPDYPALAKYATDLTELAREGKLEPANGHESDIARVIASLAPATAKAPVIIGESDLDRDLIARGVAFKLASGDAPEALSAKKVFSLNLDALAKGAHTSAEFERRVQAVFAEAEAAQVILFVNYLHQYAGARATSVASATVQAAIETNHLQVIGGASPEAYSAYVASDANIAKLFEPISIDRAETASDSASAKNKRKSPINEDFEGEKISSDMRELMRSAGPNGRVNAIVQVDDVHSREVVALLSRYGARVDARMAQFGAIKVELKAKAIEALAKSSSTNFISPDVTLESFGHVTATTGADQIRTQSCG